MEKSGYIQFSNTEVRRTGYTRLSKKEIDGRETLTRHIHQLKDAGATEVYWDIISRSSKKRVGLNSVIELVKEKLTTEIILIRLDRLTDSHSLMEEFIELVISSNIPCRGIHDRIDLTTIGGRTHARLLVTLSRNEIERISERFKDGWEGVRRRQKAVQAPFGFVTSEGRHKLDDQIFLCLLESKKEVSRGVIARELVDTFLRAKSLRGCVKSINEKYGLWHSNHHGTKAGFSTGKLLQLSPSGIKYWLTSPVLRGHLVYFRGTDKEQIIYNHHPSLITEEEHREIELILKHNKKVKGFGALKERYPLTGLIFCYECGGNCPALTSGSREGKTRQYYYYRCKNAAVGACSSKAAIRMDVVEEKVIEHLIQKTQELSNLIGVETTRVKSPRELQIEAELKTLESMSIKLPEIENAKARLKRELLEFDKHEITNKYLEELKRKAIEIFSDPMFFRTRPEEVKKGIYKNFVEKIFITPYNDVVINKKGLISSKLKVWVSQIILKI